MSFVLNQENKDLRIDRIMLIFSSFLSWFKTKILHILTSFLSWYSKQKSHTLYLTYIPTLGLNTNY